MEEKLSANAPFYVWFEIGRQLEKQQNLIQIGHSIQREAIENLERSAENALRPWIKAQYHQSKQMKNGLWTHSFEASQEKRGWHYGFVANKHITQMKHCVRAYIFVPRDFDKPDRPKEVETFTCCGIATSPSFLLTCRRKLKISTKSSIDEFSENTQVQLASAMQISSPMSVDEDSPKFTFDSSDLPEIREDKIDTNGMSSGGQNGAGREEQEEFLKLIANLLRVPVEAYCNDLDEIVTARIRPAKKQRKSSVSLTQNELSDEIRQSKERLGLHKLALFILQERSLTSTVENVLDVHADITDSHTLKLLIQQLYPKVDLFLSRYQTTLRKVASYKPELLSEYAGELPDICVPIVGSIEHHQDLGDAEEEVQLPPRFAQSPTPFCSTRSKAEFLSSIVGYWQRDEEHLCGLERLYTEMGWNWLLRKCVSYQASKFSIVYDEQGDENSLLVCNRKKIFSSGYLAYLLDGEFHPFTTTSPLIQMAPICEKYRAAYSESSEELYIEHYLANHRLTRSIRHDVDIDCLIIDVKLETRAIVGPKKVDWILLDRVKSARVFRV